MGLYADKGGRLTAFKDAELLLMSGTHGPQQNDLQIVFCPYSLLFPRSREVGSLIKGKFLLLS